MIELAILDDRMDDAEKMRLDVEDFAKTVALPISVCIFDNPFDFLECIEKEGGADIYLLDIIMPHMTGMQVAERLRKRGERCEIVFMTTSLEYGVDAFGVNAAGYLVKPVAKADLAKVLERVIGQVRRFDRPPVLIKINGGNRKVFAEDIVFIESFNHYRQVTLRDGKTLKTPTTLGQLETMLSDYKEFCSPHRAYIVNLEYVKGIQSNELLLPDRNVPIAKNAYRRFKEYYLQFCFQK